MSEAIYCEGKTAQNIEAILMDVEDRKGHVLLTRLDKKKHSRINKKLREKIDYDPISATGYFCGINEIIGTGRAVIVFAGTSDVPVAREASRTLKYHGQIATEIADVGVAGLWRLMERLDEIRSSEIIIAVAGMDAALATVLGGLVSQPVIGVPTSVGYGVSTGGNTALNSMLASCAQGVLVTNIDNGYGAACAALRIINTFEKSEI